jgi:hypothetical protein
MQNMYEIFFYILQLKLIYTYIQKIIFIFIEYCPICNNVCIRIDAHMLSIPSEFYLYYTTQCYCLTIYI